MAKNTLHELAKIIHQRNSSSSDKSYTKQLLEAGVRKCSKKLGEEAVETVIAATSEDNTALTNESADLLYHLLVLLECRQIELDDVLEVLDKRMGLSGLEEKASRQTNNKD